MRIARFNLKNQIRFGVVEDSTIKLMDGEPFEGIQLTGEEIPLSSVKLLAPVSPSKVVCIGMNYAAHAAEIGQDVPDEPLMFFKPISAIVAPEDEIVLPRQSDQVELEVELAVVISKQAKDIAESEVIDHILGFTVGNDVTARDLQFTDLQWARAKGFDTFCPLGPWIETEFDWVNTRVESRINGEVRQRSMTSDMIFDIPKLVSFVSQNLTLYPGDVILTGSPAGISRIDHGDVVECEIEGIGVLRSHVA